MNENSVGSSIGECFRGICNFLTILFCAMRASGTITWEWYWVVSPILLCEVLALIGFVLLAIIAVPVDTDDKDDE